MTVAAQKGYIQYALQVAKGGAAATQGLKAHKAIMTDLSLQEMIDQFPLEVGQGAITGGLYKNGFYSGGTFRILPRLEQSIGQLLFAITGTASATAAASPVPAGVTFYLDQANQFQLPWLMLNKYIPSGTGVANSGLIETMTDIRAVSATLTIPAAGPLQAEFGYIGRTATLAQSVDATVAATTFETQKSIPMSNKGSVTIQNSVSSAFSAAKFTGAQIILGNQTTTPDEEMVIGGLNPDDLICTGRQAVVRLVYKWNDSAIYKALRFGGALAWTPAVPTGSLSVKTVAPNSPIAGYNGYSLEFFAPMVDYTIGAPTLAPGQMIQVEITCVVKETAISTAPIYELRLLNGDAVYVNAAGFGVTSF